MTLKTKLLGAGAALLLSTGAALAVPATAQTDLNVRSGPGTQYPVVGSIQGGETVDAGSCTGSWCRVSFSGGTGYASRNIWRWAAVRPARPSPRRRTSMTTSRRLRLLRLRLRLRAVGLHLREPALPAPAPWLARPAGLERRRQLGRSPRAGRAATRRSPADRTVAASPDLRPTGSVPAPGSAPAAVAARGFAGGGGICRCARGVAPRASRRRARRLAAVAARSPDSPDRSCAAR